MTEGAGGSVISQRPDGKFNTIQRACPEGSSTPVEGHGLEWLMGGGFTTVVLDGLPSTSK